MRELDPKERIFVSEYLIDLNPIRAAIAAGYSAITAKKQAHSWVASDRSKPWVRATIQKALASKENAAKDLRARIRAELEHLSFARLGDYVEITSSGDPRFNLSDIKTNERKSAALKELTIDTTTMGSGDKTKVVKVTRIKVGLHDKLAALERLARHAGLDKGYGADDEDPGSSGPAAPLPEALDELSDQELDAQYKDRIASINTKTGKNKRPGTQG